MMVGDGINDSAALSLADVSVSLKGASTIAVDVADVIFMDGSLKQFEYLYTVTDTLNRNVRHSFLMIVIPNTVCIAGAMVGIFGLSSSLILNNGFNFLAALNSMRPLIGQDNTGQNDLLEEQLVAETEGEAQA
jgi:Cu2+-exporting ATPase